jgi:hypothetical protein
MSLRDKLKKANKRRAELEKTKHDLEVGLEDFKEEQRVQQHVSDGELKVWNEKIRKKKEIIKVEEELAEKRKEKAQSFAKENVKLTQQLQKIEPISDPKVTANELRKIRDGIEAAKKQFKLTTKKNKEAIREKENQVLAAKNEMNKLVDRLEELNKLHRVSLHKYNQNERIIKYGLYDTKGVSESQLDITYGSKSASTRGALSQVRSSQYANYQDKTGYRRDRSAVNTRNVGKKFGKNFDSNYLNSSIESKEQFTKGALSNQTSTNKLKNIKKMKNKNNVSVVYGNEAKDKIEVNKKPNQDISLGNIKVPELQPKREADNIKAHRDLDEKKNDVSKEKPVTKDAKTKQKDTKDDKRTEESQDTGSKELGQLKGLKTGQKKIETSVKL